MSTSMESIPLAFNGVDGATGAYLTPPMSLDALLVSLRRRPRRRGIGGRAVAFGNPDDLSQVGWAALFARDADPAVAEALAPLLDLRRRQAAAYSERRFRIYAGEDGLLPGESKSDFLYRQSGIGPGPVEPDRVPYYWLLVGGPDEIPFELQYQLDVQHAVGRLAFDTPWEYAQYAESVVAVEAGRVRRPRRAAILATRNPDDHATALASEHLAAPLGASLAGSAAGWELSVAVGEGADKAGFARHLGGGQTPALLFTASHGLGWDAGDPRQRSFQGALLCQDWPGPCAGNGPVARDHYFAAGDVATGADVAGLVAFFFACHGAGTPALDEFDRSVAGRSRAIAPAPLVARLPQRLLAHPRGGALAVIGHVERAWSYSFLWGRQAQVGLFDRTLRELLGGRRVGAAMELFACRLGEMGEELIAAFERQDRGDEVGDEELLRLWNAHHDARNYVVLGDPAVRLAVGGPGEEGS